MGYYLTSTRVHRRPHDAPDCPPLLAGVVSGSRYYSPEIGRWVSRDPIGENLKRQKHSSVFNPKYDLSAVEVNLYGFVQNSPPGRIDKDGRLWTVPYGRWCGPGRCGGEDSPGCEGNQDWWDNAGPPKWKDDLDHCCMLHDACLAHRLWVEGDPGFWIRVVDPRNDVECDLDLCACARKAKSGGRTLHAIRFVFCCIGPHAPKRGTEE